MHKTGSTPKAFGAGGPTNNESPVMQMHSGLFYLVSPWNSQSYNITTRAGFKAQCSQSSNNVAEK